MSDDNGYVIKFQNGSSIMVAKEVEEHLRLRGMTPPPVQEFMGMKIVCSTPTIEDLTTPVIEYLNQLYDLSTPKKEAED